MTKMFFHGLAMACSMIVCSTSASAAVVTFNGLPGSTGDALTPYNEGGFTVTPTHGAWKEAHAFGNSLPSVFVQDLVDTPFGALSVTHGGSRFTFASVDLQAFNSPIGFEIAGWLNGVQVFDLATSQAASSAFATILSPSLASIDRLTIDVSSGGAGSFNVDNINVSAVPEPASVALLLAGLGLLGWRAGRRSHGTEVEDNSGAGTALPCRQG